MRMRHDDARAARRWPITLTLSCALAMSGCGLFSTPLPPCDRSDVLPHYDAQGRLSADVVGIRHACMEKILRERATCFGEVTP